MGFLEITAALFVAFCAYNIVRWAMFGIVTSILLSEAAKKPRESFKERLKKKLAEEEDDAK